MTLTARDRVLAVLLAAVTVLALGRLAFGAPAQDDALPLPVDLPALDVDPSAAPSEASFREFCAAYDGPALEATLGDPARAGELARTMRASAAALMEVGTPRDVPDRARAGFEAWLGAAATVDGEQVTRLAAGTDPAELRRVLGMDAAQGEDLTEFNVYVTGTCFLGEE